MAFHSRDGFYFERQEDGGVCIRIADSAKIDGPVLREVTLPPNEWASVVASMTAEGENGESWRRALAAQTG